MAKFRERMLARELRNNGESVGKIAKLLKVSKGSVSLWCEDIFLSEVKKHRLGQRNNQELNKGRIKASENKKKERLERMKSFKLIGINKIGELSVRELFLVGAALYWAEGGKNQRKVVFINSDPKMILLWIRWITICLLIPKDRLTCRIEINEIHKSRLTKIENYWSSLTNIPSIQFRKASLKHSVCRKVYENNSNYYGSLQITVNKGTNLNYEILGYIDGLSGLAQENT